MSKKYQEVSKIGESTSSKKLDHPLNLPSTKDLKEEMRKELEQIFKSLGEKNVDKESAERTKKVWEEVGKGESMRKVYLTTSKELSEEDKFSQFLTASEKEENQQKSKQLESIVKNSNSQNLEKTNSDEKLPTSLFIGGGVLVVGLIAFLVIKSKIKKKVV